MQAAEIELEEEVVVDLAEEKAAAEEVEVISCTHLPLCVFTEFTFIL